MRATEPGLVIYASSSSRRFSSSRKNIVLGVQVYDRKQIMKITHEKDMDVDMKTHDTNVDKVRVGQSVKICTDALADEVFTGEVLNIVPLTDAQ